MKVYIYGLIDPRDGQIRYVGATRTELKKRIVGHIQEARTYQDGHPAQWSRKNAWILDMLSDGAFPDVIVLQESDEENRKADEKTWITRLTDAGAMLLNCHGVPDTSAHMKQRLAEKKPLWQAMSITPPPSMPPDELCARRQKLGMSQAALSRALGYSHSSVSLWESGKRTPPPGLAVLLDWLEREMSSD
jgi:DNA-binding transcriptional regulator YiaG